MSLEISKNNLFPLIQTFATTEGIKVLWPNTEWNVGNPKPADTDIWLEVILDNLNSEQPCLGRPVGGAWERDEGMATLILYYPLGVATSVGETKTGTQLAEDLKTALQYLQQSQTSTGTGTVVEAGRDPDLPYWRYNIFVEFRTDNLVGAKV